MRNILTNREFLEHEPGKLGQRNDSFMALATDEQMFSYLYVTGAKFAYRSAADERYHAGMWTQPKYPLTFYIAAARAGLYEIGIVADFGLPSHLVPLNLIGVQPNDASVSIDRYRLASVGELVEAPFDILHDVAGPWIECRQSRLFSQRPLATVRVRARVPWVDWDACSKIVVPEVSSSPYASLFVVSEELKLVRRQCEALWLKSVQDDDSGLTEREIAEIAIRKVQKEARDSHAAASKEVQRYKTMMHYLMVTTIILASAMLGLALSTLHWE